MRRVVKVGGSLLLRNDLLEALPRWMSRQSSAETLVVVGGGELVDAIRQLDRVRNGDPVETHWICVGLLDPICRIFSRWFDWQCIDTPEELQGGHESGFPTDSPTLVAVPAFYGRDRPTKHSLDLPQDWRTTTDAIAALLAQQIGADELVLLKSCNVDSAASLQQLVSQGVVDEALPMFASSLKLIRVEKLP